MIKREIDMFCRRGLRAEFSNLKEIGWSKETEALLRKELEKKFNQILILLLKKLIEQNEPNNQTLQVKYIVDRENDYFGLKAIFDLDNEYKFKQIENQIRSFYSDPLSYFAASKNVIVKPDFVYKNHNLDLNVDQKATMILSDILEEELQSKKSHFFVKGLQVPGPDGETNVLSVYPSPELKEKIQEKRQSDNIFYDFEKILSMNLSVNGYKITAYSKIENKNIKLFIPANLINSVQEEALISPSRISPRKIRIETAVEHDLIIAKNIDFL